MSRKAIIDACDHLPPSAGERRRLPLLALGVIVMGLAGLGMAAATSDARFARGLEQALTQGSAVGATPQQIQSAMAARGAPPVSGSEAFWLDNPATAAPLQPATWRPRVITRGDRFQFGGGRETRVLEVTDVRQVPLQVDGPAATAKYNTPLMMITLRDVGSPQAAPLRMLVEADAPVAGLVPLGVARQADL
ncbi:MAG: hypothetical protein AB7U75_01080 [Hyphomicrobiaceae bacterium]